MITQIESSSGIVGLFYETEERYYRGEFDLNSSIIDCHIHTNYSDAIGYSLDCLFRDINKSNIKIFSVTEHDNFNSTIAIQNKVKDKDYVYITGIELSTSYTPMRNMHIKGFFPEIPSRDSDIFNYCIDTCIKRTKRLAKVLSIFNDLFFEYKIPDFSGDGSILEVSLEDLSCLLGQPDLNRYGEPEPIFYNTYILSSYIARNLNKLRKNDIFYFNKFVEKIKNIFQLELNLRSRKDYGGIDEFNSMICKKGLVLDNNGAIHFSDDADWNYLIEHVFLIPNSKGYKPIGYVGRPNEKRPDEVITMIKDAGGIAEMAHPCETYGNNLSLLEKDLEENDLKFDGCEVYSPKNHPSFLYPLRDISNRFGLYCGFGSDTHGHITKGEKDLGNLICGTDRFQGRYEGADYSGIRTSHNFR